MKNKTAFTLSEVLVSLTIIGVIAALTIPSVMMGSNNKSNAIALKRANVILNEMAELSLSQSRFQPSPKCYYWKGTPENDCRAITKYNEKGEKYWEFENCKAGENPNGHFEQCREFYLFMADNLQVSKICGDNGYSSGCMPDYSGNDDVWKSKNPLPGDDASDEDKKAYEIAAQNAIKGCDGWTSKSLKTKPAIVTADGMIFFPYAMNNAAIMGVDINGKKGPNKFGYDVFTFTLKGNVGVTPSYEPGGCEFTSAGGKSTAAMLQYSGK